MTVTRVAQAKRRFGAKMAFAAARMILKDKRRKASKEDFRDPRNRSKVSIDFITNPLKNYHKNTFAKVSTAK